MADRIELENSDGWLLLAILVGSEGGRAATLTDIVGIGDAINHAHLQAFRKAYRAYTAAFWKKR